MTHKTMTTRPYIPPFKSLVKTLWISCEYPVEIWGQFPTPFYRHTFLNPPPLKKKKYGTELRSAVENFS